MRKPLAIALIVLLILAVAGGVGYTLLAKDQPALAERPRGDTPQDEGKPSDPLPKEDQQPVTAPNGCVEGEPVKHKFNSPDLPRAKLGEWVAAKTKDGKEAVRFRVTLVDVGLTGATRLKEGKSPQVVGRFKIEVENLMCDPFEWDMHNPGFWIGFTKRDPNSEVQGWFPSSEVAPVTNQIIVAKDGKLEGLDPNYTKVTADLIRQEFGQLPTPLPTRIEPGSKAEGYFDVVVGNMYLYKSDPYNPVGPDGNGNLPMVIGGYMSYVRVDLGSGKSWWEQKADEKDKAFLRTILGEK